MFVSKIKRHKCNRTKFKRSRDFKRSPISLLELQKIKFLPSTFSHRKQREGNFFKQLSANFALKTRGFASDQE